MELSSSLSAGGAALTDLDIELAAGKPAIVIVPQVASLTGACGWLADHRQSLRAAMHRFGGVLIRGLPVTSTEAFARVRDVLLGEQLNYQERSTPRSDLGEGVYSSTDMPARHEIRPHNESSYVQAFPGVLLFGCVVAASDGGATTVGDCREVLARIDAGLARRFRERGWTLIRNYHPSLGISWPVAFGTSDREELERQLSGGLIAWRWRRDGSLMTSQRRAAILTHPVTGAQTWFNHLAFWSRYTIDPAARKVMVASYGEDGLPFDTAYGDGALPAPDEVAHLNEVYDAVLTRERYRAGDLLMIDNLLSCHGREPYRGDRKVLVAMGEARSVLDCAPGVLPAPGPLPG